MIELFLSLPEIPSAELSTVLKLDAQLGNFPAGSIYCSPSFSIFWGRALKQTQNSWLSLVVLMDLSSRIEAKTQISRPFSIAFLAALHKEILKI